MASSPVLLFLFITILLAATSVHAQYNSMSPPPAVAPAPVACVPAPEPVASVPEPTPAVSYPVASPSAPEPVPSVPEPTPAVSYPVASPSAPVASPPAASPPAPVASPPAPVAPPPAPVASPPAGGSGQCTLNDIAKFRVCLNLGIGRMGTASRDLCCRRIHEKPVVNAVNCLCTTFLQFNVGVNVEVANKVNAILEICGTTRVSNLVCR